MGALKRFVDRHFKVSTQAYTIDVVAMNGIELLVPNNPDRLMFSVMNLSDTDVYVSPDSTPSATHGVLLQSGGGAMALSALIDGELVGYEWNVFCTVDTKAVFVVITEGGA